MINILIRYTGFKDTETNFNNITSINSHFNVFFYYLSNERFATIAVLEL